MLTINEECIGCGTCVAVCPVEAIVPAGDLYAIIEKCTECGACVDVCPVNAIIE